MLAMKRAFIAAPLLGTIIFFASIVFIVNLNKAEAGEVALITSEAYHNRIVSLLEVYRTDLGSQFRENLSRVIENFLASECWDNLFNVYNVETDTGRSVSMAEVRKSQCEHVTTVIHQVICSFSASDCQGAGVDCTRYGLPEWMAKIAENFTFEGIKFYPSNLDEFSVFLDSSSNPAQYQKMCETLLQGSIFDCDAFAQGDFKCTDKMLERGDGGQLEPGPESTWKEVPGCEKGTFYVKVKVLDQLIYPHMPRIFSDDGTGNQIRSGAISDENFNLPINYPLFKYYNYSFGVFENLAYGTDARNGNGGSPQQNGIAEGFCGSEPNGNCENVKGYNGPGFQSPDEADTQAVFFDNAFTKACAEHSTSSQQMALGAGILRMDQTIAGSLRDADSTLQLEVCTGTCSTALGNTNWVNCTQATVRDFTLNSFGIDNAPCASNPEQSGDGTSCNYILDYGTAARMRFVDYDHSLQANPNHLNEFCWRANPVYEGQPQQTP
ncbi:hypothetical protein COX86_03455 [Candidatus Micrarchaeota archaeon CG_4_10_14_0_2_um_filter_60_11]|nr:MAG: hypothetical protein COX86_03455 [Candidatus Micrarchaeota archaeon CG_4_10_14_0_2_um_filter_60_11]